MRIGMVLAVCIALAAAGCETDEPLDGSSSNSNLQVLIAATSENIPLWDVWTWTEDTIGNGILEHEPDEPQGACDVRAPFCEGPKPNGDGRLDAGEDVNHNGVLDPGEDKSGNGALNTHEDFIFENGVLDLGEDVNGNCVLDPGEDVNADGILNTEDCDCDGWLDVGEDLNRNGTRELEDIVDGRNRVIDAGLWCEDSAALIVDGPIPVPIAGEVLVYRAGNPTPEVVTSLGTSGGAFTGLTPYDERVFGQLGNKQVPYNVAAFPGQTLTVTNGRTLSNANSFIMNASRALSPLWLPEGQTEPTHRNRCTVGFGFGQPNLGVPLPVTALGRPGDTMTVRVIMDRVFNEIEQHPGLPLKYNLTGAVVMNGRQLAASGTTGTDVRGGTIAFSVVVP